MSWSGWFNIGAPAGGYSGGPATISRNKDVCNVYVRGTDNALWQRAYYDGQWHPWGRHNDGGVLSSEPALGSMGPDHEHVFVRGTDGNVWQKYWQWTAEPVGEVSFAVNECVYGWTARYRQAGTHTVVRIQLNPDAGITAATMNALRTTWRDGIIATWANRFRCLAPNGGQQSFTFDVQWVTSGAHHVVRVLAGPARSNMTNWDTDDTGNVAAHEFGHMIGHPDEYADATCPARNPVGTGTVMDDNTETVARLYNRLASFHGGGHTPTAGSPLEPEEQDQDVTTMKLIDNLKPEPRARVLDRLRAVAAVPGAVPDDLAETEITFEVAGGAPGERYSYRLGVRADGTAERHELDELQGTKTVGVNVEATAGTRGNVDPEVAGRVFAAAQEVGLLDDEAPVPPERGEIVPDSLIAIITVRDGDVIRRVVVPATEPVEAVDPSAAAAADVPLSTPMRLGASTVEAWQPVLAALRAVEAAL